MMIFCIIYACLCIFSFSGQQPSKKKKKKKKNYKKFFLINYVNSSKKKKKKKFVDQPLVQLIGLNCINFSVKGQGLTSLY